MKKIVVAVTGASGSIYAKRTFDNLQRLGQQTELTVGAVLSKNAADVWAYELGGEPQVPFPVYERMDYRAPFASGSAGYKDMIIVPCSMGTLGRIANGFSDDLITRAADVMLKERGNLICVLRDSPYNLIHIQNMERLVQAGATILPASPSFYSRPQSFEDLADTIVHRALSQVGLDPKGFQWGE
jgi:4-hydroxy-3-polyprenylbenzoate decarboxylase